jgi:small subunit ribosomal protein S20
MANHASALKRNRQNEKRRVINQMNRHKLRTQIKKLKTAIETGESDQARQLLSPTFSLIDRSVQKGVLTTNAARRYKSRMNRSVNALAAA